MRRRICIFMIALLFCFSACAEAPAVLTEQEMAEQLEQEYGIRILLGDEVTEIPTDEFVVHPAAEYGNYLMGMLSLTRTEQALKILGDVLSEYPEEFFGRFQQPVVFCLTGEISDPIQVQGMATAGFCHIEEENICLFLDTRFMTPDLIHHEIWHCMEAMAGDAFPDWNDLNPEGFTYTQDMGDYSGLDPEWFCREYSVTFQDEDRATVFESYFTESPEWWEEHPHIKKKLDRILLFLEDPFGWRQ